MQMRFTVTLGAVLLLCAALVAACSERKQAPRERPRDAIPSGRPESGGAAEQYAPKHAVPVAPGAGEPMLVPRPPRQGGSANAAATAEAKARDLARELAAAVGDIRPCLAHLRPEGSGRITIGVSALVSAGGSVAAAEATGAELDDQAARCIERMAEGAHLKPPIPDPPLNVSTSIDIDYKTPPPPKPPEVEDRPLPRGAQPISGPKGQPIAPSPGVPIQPSPGRAIEPSPGQPIEPNPGKPIQASPGQPIVPGG